MSIRQLFTKKSSLLYSRLMDINSIKQRSLLAKNIRSWFEDHNYLEVSTPVLSTHLIPEPTIAHFSTRYISEFYQQRDLYLVPSPEVHMKHIIRETQSSIFQISQCFRNREQIGSHHNPEFTMLEYYTVGADEVDSIAITEQLMKETALEGTKEHLLPPFNTMSVSEAMYTYAQVDLEKTQSLHSLKQEAQRLGLSLPEQSESWEETFHRIFLQFVEPNLPQEKPLVLYDYPMQIECLAKQVPNKPYKKRWELYAGGIEVANCYDEQTDKEKVREFYTQQYAQLIHQRSNSDEVIPDIDLDFIEIFDEHFPQCSGVALGFDRLLMLQGGYNRVGDLMLFNVSDMIHPIR